MDRSTLETFGINYSRRSQALGRLRLKATRALRYWRCTNSYDLQGRRILPVSTKMSATSTNWLRALRTAVWWVLSPAAWSDQWQCRQGRLGRTSMSGISANAGRIYRRMLDARRFIARHARSQSSSDGEDGP